MDARNAKKITSKVASATNKPIKNKTRPVFEETPLGAAFSKIFTDRFKPQLDITILKTLFKSDNFGAEANKIVAGLKNNKAVCGKILTSKDVGFKCLDCEKDATCIICKQCYENGDHKGHRVQLQKNVGGCCDCGDPDAWDEKGFCCDHPGYAKFKPSYSIEDIPLEFRENFIEVFEKCFFYLFNLYEELAINPQEDTNLQSLVDYALLIILSVLENCGEKSMVFLVLVCQLFKTKLSDRNRELYLKATNLKKMEFDTFTRKCDLTYLECLFYFHQLNTSKCQKKIEEFCIKLFLDYDFKIYIAHTFIKMINYVYPFQRKITDLDLVPYSPTDLYQLSVQLFTAEEFSIIAIDSPHFPEFMDLYQEMIQFLIISPSPKSLTVFLCFNSFYGYTVDKQSSRKKLLYSEVFMRKILDCLNFMNYCFKIDVTKNHTLNPTLIENFSLLLDLEYKILKLVDKLFAELKLDQDLIPKTKLIRNLAEQFVNMIKRNDIQAFKDRAEFDKSRTLHIPLYRAFGLFVKNLVNTPSYQELQDLLKNDMQISDRNIEIIAHFLFKMGLRTATLPIDNDKKAWEFCSQLFTWFTTIYKSPQLSFYDCDVFLMQFSLMFIHLDDLCMSLENSSSINTNLRSLFSAIGTGTFNKETFQKSNEEFVNIIKDSLNTSQSASLKKKKESNNGSLKIDALLDEFLNLIILLCTDQISTANLFSQRDKMSKNPHQAFCQEVYKDVIINLLQKQNKMNFQSIRDVLGKKLLRDKVDIEEGLLKATTFLQASKTFQLKDEFMNVFEPFTFLKDPQLLVEIHDTIKTRLKSSQMKPDFVVGNSSYVYEYKYAFLNRIQERVFESPLFEFEVECLVASAEMTRVPGMIIKPVLKFLHMALSFALHFKKKSLILKLAKLLDRKEFLERMKDLRADSSNAETHLAIDKILQLIKEVQQLSSLEVANIVEEGTPATVNNSARNQEAIQERMREIKKKFVQKRENFLQKNKLQMEEEEESMNQKEQIVCNICHSDISNESEYGIPAYFGESSLHNLEFARLKQKLSGVKPSQQGEIQEEQKEGNTEPALEAAAFAEYPIVNTCSHNFHYIHKECFEKHSRKAFSNETSFVFSNELEFSCTLCKSLCNVFITANSPQNVIEEEAKTEDELQIEIKNIKDALPLVEGLAQLPVDNRFKADSVFNDVMMLLVLDAGDKDVQDQDENEILKTFDKLFSKACHLISFGGFEFFVKNKLTMYKLLLNSYKNFYRTHVSNLKASYFQSLKRVLSIYLRLLTGEKCEDLSEEEKKQLFKDCSGEKLPLLSTPDEFLFDVMQHLVVSSNIRKELLLKFIHRIMRIYLLHKLVEVYAKKKLSKNPPQEFSFEIFIKELSNGMKTLIKEELANGILPSVRKVATFLLLNTDIPKEAAFELSNADFTTDEEELTVYLRIEGLNTTTAEFLSEGIFDYAGISQESVKLWLDGEPKLAKESLTPYLLTCDQEVGFNFIALPENYYELSTDYIEKKCELCLSRSEKGSQCICLLCGKILCSLTCKTGMNLLLGGGGNLNTHSNICHAGEAAFVNVETGTIYLIRSPKNVEYGVLYVDRLGNKLDRNDRFKDWKSFKVDQVLLDSLREKFIYEKVPQEVSYIIQKKMKKFHDSLL